MAPGSQSTQSGQSTQRTRSTQRSRKPQRLAGNAAVMLACAVTAAMSTAPSAVSARATQEFRSRVDLVNVGVTVTDRKGTLATDLTADDFEIFEDGKKQAIQYFASGEQSESAPPMHLGLMLDVSGSMDEDIGFTRTAAVKFLNTLTDAVDITVVDFDTEVRLARYSQNEFARLVERIRRTKVAGMTA